VLVIAYVQELARNLQSLIQVGTLFSNLEDRFKVLVEELDRLDPRDFVDSDRAKFVDLRRTARAWSQISRARWQEIARDAQWSRPGPVPPELVIVADLIEVPEDQRDSFQLEHRTHQATNYLLNHARFLCDNLIAVLDSYGGPGSQAVTRSFGWVKHKALRTIVGRDFRELTLFVYPSGAWKSAVVMAGSILEAILYDLLTRSSSRVRKAMASKAAPRKDKGANVRDIRKNKNEDEWRLADLIKVAFELDLLPADREKLTDQALRDYRNFIHPHKEVRADLSCSEAIAMTAVGALLSVCDHLEKA
jgi:hypothetical protein